MVSQQLAREIAGLESIPEEHLMSFLQLAHELRSPLATVLHCLDVVLQGYTSTNPALQNELLNRARERAAGMLNQLNDFLRLGAVRHEELVGRCQSAQLLDTVNTLAPEMRVRARWRAVNLVLDLPTSLPRVASTREDVEHLLSNLLNNGIKYTNPGGTVTLLLREIDAGVLGRVVDTGIGIAAEDLPHVFDEFYRGDNARAMDNQGTGLGLAIAKRVVDRCGGWIHVESALGRGSEFSFFIPGERPARARPS